MATVLLVRHGESTWNRERRMQGWAPTTLTDRGREQSRALASYIREHYRVDRLLSSDLHRTQETAREISRAVGVDPEFDPDWRERDIGNLQGLSVDELFEQHPQHSLVDAGYLAAEERPPGGESLVDTRERVLNAWNRLHTDLAPDETTVVVTHGGPLYLLLGHLTGENILDSVIEREQDNCGLTEIGVQNGSDTDGVNVRVVRENETEFLRKQEN